MIEGLLKEGLSLEPEISRSLHHGALLRGARPEGEVWGTGYWQLVWGGGLVVCILALVKDKYC